MSMLTPLHGIFWLLLLATVVVKLAALVDCVRQPERAFVVAGKQTKKLWLVILAAAVVGSFIGFLSIIGLIAAIVYFVDVRPAVRGSSHGGW